MRKKKMTEGAENERDVLLKRRKKTGKKGRFK